MFSSFKIIVKCWGFFVQLRQKAENIAADIESKNIFQILVVSKTRLPSVDDELRINHLGTNKTHFT